MNDIELSRGPLAWFRLKVGWLALCDTWSYKDFLGCAWASFLEGVMVGDCEGAWDVEEAASH